MFLRKLDVFASHFPYGKLLMMLAKAYRLSAYEIERAKKKGVLSQFNLFGLSIRERGDEENSKFGVIVSKKIAKNAVDRNRIKRMILEAVRYETKCMVSGKDVVFLVKKNIMTKSTDEIMDASIKALKTKKILVR